MKSARNSEGKALHKSFNNGTRSNLL